MIHENKAGQVIAIEGASHTLRGKTEDVNLYITYASGISWSPVLA
jgi:hypothetical protein